jgi:uncharacterized protein YcfL
MKKLFKLSAVILMVFAAGCMTDNPTMRIESYRGGVPVAESFLDYWLNIREVVKDTDGELMRVMIRVENKHERLAAFEYRYLWFDKDRFPVDPDAAVSKWSSFTLEPSDVKELVGIAPSPDAVEYRFEVRYPKSVYKPVSEWTFWDRMKFFFGGK